MSSHKAWLGGLGYKIWLFFVVVINFKKTKQSVHCVSFVGSFCFITIFYCDDNFNEIKCL